MNEEDMRIVDDEEFEPTVEIPLEDDNIDMSQFEEVDETSDGEMEEVDNVDELRLQQLLNKVTKQANDNNSFSRTENKYDFASEVINAPENQKTGNLTDGQVDDLIKKRKFTNFCKAYGWNVLANIVGKVVTDVEGYSLSEKGFLVRLTSTDIQRSASVSEQRITKKKKVKGGEDDFYG